MKAEQASTTAKVIAASTILLASDPRTRGLVAPGAAQLSRQFLSGTRTDRLFAASAKFPPTRTMWRWVDRLTLPGIVAHFWHRKRWIEQRCRSAIAEGFERVIVLGAGFDTLGLRLCQEFSHLTVVEIDHPATQSAKRQAMARAAMPTPANLDLVPLDLGGAPLPAAVHADHRRTIVIAEGLLMYLPPADVDRLLDALRGLAVERLRFIFSYITRWPDGNIGFRPQSKLIHRWLAWRGEPFKWAIEPRLVPEFLARHRFGLVEMALTQDFSQPSAPNRALLEGENLVVCEPI
ncbi:MAG TPA: class I SAM-dependent methyltransferase [Xanthomonadaceae bacterium]|nr:class I SAM-dependent methyltransferase [Xanthomonadaceae bacterium]